VEQASCLFLLSKNFSITGKTPTITGGTPVPRNQKIYLILNFLFFKPNKDDVTDQWVLGERQFISPKT
jgi:hypothetical protein